MLVELEDPIQCNKRLQRCINDLISVVALPAIWTGSEPGRILGTLMDALLGMLTLDVVYVRLLDSSRQGPREMVKIAPDCVASPEVLAIRQYVDSWLLDYESSPAERIYSDNDSLCLAPIRLGLRGELGLMVAGCRRSDFPQQAERLLLGVAANQAAIGLQEARLLSEQKRLAIELDQRVGQRTEELAERNEQLTKEIAARSLAEQRVIESELNLRRMTETIPAMLWSATPDGAIDYCNTQVFEYTGVPVKEILGEGWRRLLHPDDVEPTARLWTYCVQTGEPYEVEVRTFHAADRTYRCCLTRALPSLDQQGRIVKWHGTIVDLEDWKQSEEKLRRSEERWRSVFENSAVGVAITDLDGRFVATNPVYQQMLGYTEEELRELSSLDTTQQEFVEWNRRLIGELLHGKRQQFQIEKQYRRKDGKLVWVRNSVSVVPGSERVPRFLMALSEDITERKQAEEALAKARSDLARSARINSLAMLTASIAHEVSQPLSGIVTNASTCLRMLAADPPNVDGARETARRTIRDGNRASEVITRLRTLFGKKEVRAEPLNLNQAIGEVIALSLSELQRERVCVRTELASDLFPVVGDRVQLQQVVLNLLRNACDAMNVVVDRPRELIIRTERDGSYEVRVSVTDAGTGFDHEAEEEMFEAFYTTKTDGMGIGLSISRSIIEAHHGRLWALRNHGPGATFSFSIPCVNV